MNSKMTRRDFNYIMTLGIVGCALKEGVGLFNPDISYSQDLNKKTVLCFDGSKSNEKWRKTIDLGKRLSDISGYEVNFTYYINTAYFFEEMKGSTIGAGGSSQDIEERLKLIQEAIDEGHEIGCHTVRHRNGSNWTVDEWYKEIGEFDNHLAESLKDRDGNPYKAIGMRAPYLAHNDNMYKALKRLGYIYDVSMVSSSRQIKEGISVVPVPYFLRENGKIILAMDYNWHVNKVSDKGFEYMLNHEMNPQKNNKPLIISLHFEDWKNGDKSYYEVTEDFLVKMAEQEKIRIYPMKDIA